MPRSLLTALAVLCTVGCGPKSSGTGDGDETTSTSAGTGSEESGESGDSTDDGEIPDHCPSEEEVLAAAANAVVGSEVPCPIPNEPPLDGIVDCDDGLTHRPYAGLVDDPRSAYAYLSSCQQTGGPCESDGDCGAGPFGECVRGEDDDECQCFYGCRCDADCPSDRACVRGECIPADCSVDGDCGEYACALSPFPPVSASVLNDILACQTAADDCRTAADCIPDPTDCTGCVYKPSGWTCDSICGD